MRRLVLLGLLLSCLAGLAGCGSKDTGPTSQGTKRQRPRVPAPEDVKK